MLLSQAIQEFMKTKEVVQRVSSHTLGHYKTNLQRFLRWFDDVPDIEDITSDQIKEFISTLNHLSKKSLLNTFSDLSALWTWAVEEKGYASYHVMRKIKAPRPEKKEVIPFTEEEVKKLLKVLGVSRTYTRKNLSQPYELNKEIHARNQALFLFLLDSGAREMEARLLKVDDIRLGERGVYLVRVNGKGDKERVIGISTRTQAAIEKYLVGRAIQSEYVFTNTTTGKPMVRGSILRICERVAARARVNKVHPHRFRHTFAINFLRNGGDAYTLQKILGHSDMGMVTKYLAISRADIERCHAKASPVINWSL